MKERRREMDESKITGFFDKDTHIRGELEFKGSFRIDGNFKGNINSESVLIIGENGKVEADIQIGYIIVDGEVKGNIRALEKVEIHSRGRVIGTIASPKLIIEEGAYLEASCQTTDKPMAQKTDKEILVKPKEEKPPEVS
jgi:cytoskeletal protein CcmA (bactofilin family)